MKKRLLALSLAAGFTALMTACGDETTNTDILKANSFASDSLPTCDASYSGMLANDTSKNAIFACTKVGASYEWVNVIKNIQAAEDNSGCTTKELEDKSGVDVVCMGKTIATLKNGAKGEDGAPGTEGEDGDKGPVGDDASGYSDGKDLKLDSTDCRIVNPGIKGFVFYKCGNTTYAENMNGKQADVKTWNALNKQEKLMDRVGNTLATLHTVYQPASDPTKSVGALARWESDVADWEDDKITTDNLKENFAVTGTATLTVQEDSLISTGSLYMEPFIGFVAKFGSSQDLLSWGGVCLTYKSDSPMELVIANAFGNNVRATLKASAKETTVDLLPDAFKMDYLTLDDGIKLKDVMSGVSFLVVKVVGGLEKGTYTNTFSIAEMGAYGRCGDPTIDQMRAKAKTLNPKEGTLEDKRTDPAITYKTVTIGSQTWMAENLRIPYNFKTDDGDDNPATDGGEPMALCPTDPDQLVAKGCLYRWSAAVDSASRLGGKSSTDPNYNECGYNKSCTITGNVQGICPDGWHLPSKKEFETLIEAATIGDHKKYTYMLLMKDYANVLGLSLVPAGRSGNLTSVDFAYVLYAWSSEQSSDAKSHLLFIDPTAADNLRMLTFDKSFGLTVRCVKDKK